MHPRPRPRQYLIVANQTLGGDALLAEVGERMRAGPCHFHVLVPATPTDQLDPAYLASVSERARRDTGDDPDRRLARLVLEDEVEDVQVGEPVEDPGRTFARRRLREALARLRALGADASGEVGVADPVAAIGVVLHRQEFDGVILSTLPGHRSRWLAMDLPHRIRRSYKLPVTQVTSPASPASPASP